MEASRASNRAKGENMRTSVWARAIITPLSMCALAALAAPAFGDDLVLHRDGSKAVPFAAHVRVGHDTSSEGSVLRRDGSRAVPFIANVNPNASGSGWDVAAIGASSALGLAVLGLGGAVALSKRRRQARPAPSIGRP
jgi:hypothetical protein